MNPSHDDAIFVAESRIIRKLSSEKPCVIMGRLANWILRNNSNVLRVFITSDKEFAIKNVIEKDGLSIEEARLKIEKINKGRSNHYLQYTGSHWTDARDYDLVINTSKTGIDRAVDLISKEAML